MDKVRWIDSRWWVVAEPEKLTGPAEADRKTAPSIEMPQ
jgi:hypothetical protein